MTNSTVRDLWNFFVINFAIFSSSFTVSRTTTEYKTIGWLLQDRSLQISLSKSLEISLSAPLCSITELEGQKGKCKEKFEATREQFEATREQFEATREKFEATREQFDIHCYFASMKCHGP